MLTILTSGPLRQLIVLGAFSVACGGDIDTTPDDRAGDALAGAPVAAASAAESSEDSPADAASAPFAFTAADLVALERGLARETEAVEAARARGRAAKTPAERGQAAQGEWEDQTIPEGARAAGIPLERYRKTRATVHQVLQTLDFQGKIDGPLEMDVSAASDEMKAQLRSDPMASLAPASAAALRARMGTVTAVWIRYMRLVAVNG